MTPVSFQNCFGWFHPASKDVGVVICNAYGHEDLSTHKGVRLMAESFADAGFPSLRFDYDGTGDSLGRDRDVNRVESWLASVEAAVHWLRDTQHVTRVVLVGLRLGANFATLTAERLGTIDGLILLAPIVQGRNYLREMTALSGVVGGAPDARLVSEAHGLEACGFVISQETQDAIKAIDLTKLTKAPAPQALVVSVPGQISSEKLGAHFDSLGCATTREDFDFYAEFLADATFARTPVEVIAKAKSWLETHFADAGPRVAGEAIGPAMLHDPTFSEEMMLFGPHANLAGVFCSPARPTAGPTVIFLNAGSNHHIGWARVTVDLSRRLASLGLSTFRMDVSGLGDSAALDSRADPAIYAIDTMADVKAAIDLLTSRGMNDIALIGLCSGAYLSFHTAVEDERVKRVMMVNLQRFIWKQGDSLDIVYSQTFQATGHYFAKMKDPDTWKRVLRGEVKGVGIARVLVSRLLNKIAAKAKTDPEIENIRNDFTTLAARSVQMLMVMSSSDYARDELDKYMGKDAKMFRALPNTRVEIIDGADHNITPRWAREILAIKLCAFLKS